MYFSLIFSSFIYLLIFFCLFFDYHRLTLFRLNIWNYKCVLCFWFSVNSSPSFASFSRNIIHDCETISTIFSFHILCMCVWVHLRKMFGSSFLQNERTDKKNNGFHFFISFEHLNFNFLPFISSLSSFSSSIFLFYFDSSFRAASPISPRIFHMGLPAHSGERGANFKNQE